MAYYFPFGAQSAVTVQNLQYSNTSVTASTIAPPRTYVESASFASVLINTPSAGSPGANKTAADCTGTAPDGAKGGSGTQGNVGSNVTGCPAGTIECTGLATYLPNLNNVSGRPSGSQFSIVCMEIPPGCNSSNSTCPSYLPSASVTSTYPSIP